MTFEQYVKNLEVPQNNIDVVLDTDAYNEVDDQFAGKAFGKSYLCRAVF